MPGKKILTGCMGVLFVLILLSMWLPIPRIYIQSTSVLVFVVSAIRNCKNYKEHSGHHSILLWGVALGCVIVAGISAVKDQLGWRILYILLLYLFFILAEWMSNRKIQKSNVFSGGCIIIMVLINAWTNQVWVRRVIFGLQLILLLRLLNPLLEEVASRGKRHRIASEGELAEGEISWVRKILFGRSGRLRFPGI